MKTLNEPMILLLSGIILLGITALHPHDYSIWWRGGSVQLDSISHFLSGSLAVNAYAAFGSAGMLAK